MSLATLGMPLAGYTQTTKVEEATPTSRRSSDGDVVKVGEFQPLGGRSTSDDVITKIHPHTIGGRKAATLFIRNIPVLTFLGSQSVSSVDTKVGAVRTLNTATNSSKLMSATQETDSPRIHQRGYEHDPVYRAGLIAASINKLVRHHVDAKNITVTWQIDSPSDKTAPVSPSAEKQGRYVIKVSDEELVEINENNRLAGTTNSRAEEALQATNRLRRVIGNAPALSEIANLPKPPVIAVPKQVQRVARGVRRNIQGVASFYGRGFAGRPTATGERFNPGAMTAAHRTLPFGTRVRVTNTRNGRSVVVRINDRGPFIRGRVIDLSTAAARALGMINSGLAPVKIEVLGR